MGKFDSLLCHSHHFLACPLRVRKNVRMKVVRFVALIRSDLCLKYVYKVWIMSLNEKLLHLGVI